MQGGRDIRLRIIIKTMKGESIMWPSILRLIRTAVAMGLPVLISWLTGNPDIRWAALAPIIVAVAKYLRDVLKWEWLPV